MGVTAQSNPNLHQMLARLVKLSNDLSHFDDVSELCRSAVERGRRDLAFDRLSIWLVESGGEHILGTFGTDEHGQIRDERAQRLPTHAPGSLEFTATEDRPFQLELDVSLRNHEGRVVGHGDRMIAGMWDGPSLIGTMAMDNLLHGHPIDDMHTALLSMYATTVCQLIRRVRANEAARESEAYSALILQSLPTALFLSRYEPEFQCLWVSEQIADLCGFPASRFTEDPQFWSRRIHPDDRQRVLDALHGIQPDQTIETAYRWRCADDTYRWFSEMEVVTRRGFAGTKHLMGVWVDITQRKEAEKALAESERMLAEAQRIASLGSWHWSQDSDSVHWSDQVYRLLGYEPGEIELDFTLLYYTHLHADDRKKLNDAASTTLETGDPQRSAIRVVRRDGQTRHWDVHFQTLRDAAGETVELVCTAMDITDLRDVESELNYRLDFDRLIMDISTRFMALSADQIEHEVNDALMRVGQFLAADRSYLFVFNEACTEFTNTHEWCADGIEPSMQLIQDLPVREFSWFCDQLFAGEVIRVPNVESLPIEAQRLKVELQRQSVRSMMCIPVTIQGRVRSFIGLDQVRSTMDWSDDTVRLLRIVGDMLISALERRRAEVVIDRHREQLRALDTQLVLVEEKERRRLAGDLHDGLSQTLTLANIKLQTLQHGAGGNGFDQDIQEVSALLDGALQSAHSLTFELSPPVLHDIGLVAALDWLMDDMRNKYDLRVVLDDDGQDKPLDERYRVVLFRAVRELLINIAKYAGVRDARVMLRTDGNSLSVSVVDHGCGFDPAQVETASIHGGFGLFSLNERLRQLGGEMLVTSEPEKGTSVVLTVPLHQSVDTKREG